MRKLPTRWILLLVLAQLCALPALAAKTVAEIQACMDANLPDESSIQTIRLTAYDRVGDSTELRAKLYWTKGEDARSKLFMEFDSPADLRGAALLMLEKASRSDIFMYLPELQKVKRVSTHMMRGSMFGTDFSYEEFEQLQGMADDSQTERAPDTEVRGRAAYVLDQRPEPDADSDYERIRSFVDRETCVLLQVEFYAAAGELEKRMGEDFSTVTQETSGYFARKLTMHSLLERTHTTLIVDSLELDVKIPRKRFSQAQLSRSGR
jgi:hypothetical protein